MASHTWDPERYLGLAGERGRPFSDLVARVEAVDPQRVVDLGCGTGNLTALLASLQDLGCFVDAWETTYRHVLPGKDAVLDWVLGTGAAPTVEALPRAALPTGLRGGDHRDPRLRRATAPRRHGGPGLGVATRSDHLS